MAEQAFTNHLIHETSPYLLQHAHNPVDWYPWSDEAWKRAKEENKLVIVSIGYSSCHWCHVMEHESFEDTTVAGIMNKNFICIKVDREERPDIDQVYMTASQLMTGGGGWPLNCITLPDGRPIYGGTYFPKTRWANLLIQLADYYSKNQKEAEEYAAKLTEGIQQVEIVKFNEEKASFRLNDLKDSLTNWKKSFDNKEGGTNRAPKFPMPNNYEMLLRYYDATKEQEVLDHVLITLNKMAYGGIYDQIGGGFARYSTDSLWKVPHFEKMLYDNAQLVSLYSMAYQFTRTLPLPEDEGPAPHSGGGAPFRELEGSGSLKDLYKQVVYETCDFIKREMTAPDGGFYSALDADSEGEEGKFYVWTKDELQKLLSSAISVSANPAAAVGVSTNPNAAVGVPTNRTRFDLFAEYFNVNDTGYWENGNYILLRKESDEAIAMKFGMSIDEVKKEIAEDKKILLAERNKRVRPGLDDKQLTSWNALMLKAYCDAYNAFGDATFLDAAKKNASHNWEKLWRKEGGYVHSYKTPSPSSLMGMESTAPGSTGLGFLEDYAFSAQAFISLYQCTFEEVWLQHAREITDYAIKHFYDPKSGMFFFTSDEGPALIARKMELGDNVVPSSNSAMARVLFYLALYFDDEGYSNMSTQMLNNVQRDMKQYPSAYSNWGILMLYYSSPFNEIVITGKDAMSLRYELARHFLPNTVFAGASDDSSKLGLLEHRFVKGKNFIYVCENKTCKLPVATVEEALQLLKQ